jgi:hypothetical protein
MLDLSSTLFFRSMVADNLIDSLLARQYDSSLPQSLSLHDVFGS